MEDSKNDEAIGKKNEELDRKFNYILDLDHKSKKFDEFLLMKIKNQNLFNDILTILEQKIELTCNEKLERLYAYSKKVDGNSKIILPESGYEVEFKNAEVELKDCVKEYNIYKDSLENDIINLKRLAIESYNLCTESCKQEMKNKNLNENLTRNCLNGCFRFLLMNKEIFNDIVYEKLGIIKEEINNLKV